VPFIQVFTVVNKTAVKLLRINRSLTMECSTADVDGHLASKGRLWHSGGCASHQQS